MKDHWQESWTRSKLPVYFVLVVVDEQDRAAWLDHRSDGTFHRAAAYWTRVDTGTEADRISIDKTQRLTTETFHTWNTDLLDDLFRTLRRVCLIEKGWRVSLAARDC